MEDVGKAMDYLMEAEELGCDILNLRREMLELHKRASECREANSEIRQSEQNSFYMLEGALLVKNKKDDIIKRLTNDHAKLQAEIKLKGEELRKKVFKLQDLEMQAPFTGRDLMPLDKDELKALAQVWGESA